MNFFRYGLFTFLVFLFLGCDREEKDNKIDLEDLEIQFKDPPISAYPGVYWYFMDGWMSKEGIRKDLVSMKEAGIRYVVFLEVNVGVPQGPVDFLSDEWYELFEYAEKECRRLGIQMTLGIGPGWSGSGGPWISGEKSMKILVADTLIVEGPKDLAFPLPKAKPVEPFFGVSSLTPLLNKEWEDYYEDIGVVAFPLKREIGEKIDDLEEKAFFYRAPYSSGTVKPYLLSNEEDKSEKSVQTVVRDEKVLDISVFLQEDSLRWYVPEGKWVIMRVGMRNNGAVTRPAPMQGMGFESDKYDSFSTIFQLDSYVGEILSKINFQESDSFGGLKTLHLDSWEMGSQNWSEAFRDEFIYQKKYDPFPFLPVLYGFIVNGKEKSQRFLWDLRDVGSNLIYKNYISEIKKYAHNKGLKYSNEPYDMNPTSDLELGSFADIPMGEFWSKGYGFNTVYSCLEATSIGHTKNISIVQAEAFTAGSHEAWKQFPGSMKQQGDWAFALGINRLFYHTFQHKSLDDSIVPGITMGPYGVHWDRKQTWWPLVLDYHKYIARCQYLLQKGETISDILFLIPEGAPQVFVPPVSSLKGDSLMPDKRGFGFDGCPPSEILNAKVKDGKIILKSGVSYEVLVLPQIKTITFTLFQKIRDLINDGALVIGMPPQKSPSLMDYPEEDSKITKLSSQLWPNEVNYREGEEINYGKGSVFFSKESDVKGYGNKTSIYPTYELISSVLRKKGLREDFSGNESIRFHHKKTKNFDIYFVSNSSQKVVESDFSFRVDSGIPEIWDPITGLTYTVEKYREKKNSVEIPLRFDPLQSYFIVFSKSPKKADRKFPDQLGFEKVADIKGPWEVHFEGSLGGPKVKVFDELSDWRDSENDSIKYYSGIAKYLKKFEIDLSMKEEKDIRYYLNMGKVRDLASLKLNDSLIGTVWTYPYRLDITEYLKEGQNRLEIDVANRWVNRLIGDSYFVDDGIKDGKFPQWILEGKKRASKRKTFTTHQIYTPDSTLTASGLLGPVAIEKEAD